MGDEVVTKWRLSGAVVAATFAVAGCGSSQHATDAAVSKAGPKRCHAGAVRRLETSSRGYAAFVRTRARAFARPGTGAIARFGRNNVNGVPSVFSVRAAVLRRDCSVAWYRVQLPIKPNGRVGYVRARDVRLRRVRTRIGVDLSARRLSYFRDGRVVLRTRVGIGSPETPTPVGRFYVNQSFREEPAGPYGPAAIGISAYSPVLTTWDQAGPVAIHGTDRSWTIGRAASNGCIHVPNALVRRLFRITPVGTPVVIVA